MFKISNILILFLGLFLGYKIEKHDLYQGILAQFQYRENKRLGVSEWHDSKLTYSNYSFGVPMYLDKPYTDSIGDKKLEDLRIIKIARHQKANINIESKYPITIYRITTSENHGLMHDYEKTNIKVKLLGVSSIHDKVVKKEFKPGKIVLAPGGPVSASPILFQLKDNLNTKIIDIFSNLQPGL